MLRGNQPLTAGAFTDAFRAELETALKRGAGSGWGPGEVDLASFKPEDVPKLLELAFRYCSAKAGGGFRRRASCLG